MTYFVTGASGFLGGRTVELLLERGERVIAMGRNPDPLKYLQSLGAEIVQAELTDRDTLMESIPEHSKVVHCAALSTPWASPRDYFKANVLGTQVVSSVAREKQVERFVHISTPSIYVDFESRENIRESEPLPKEMINDYARTKLQAEKWIDLLASTGLKAITLRPQGIFGPRDTAIFPRLIRIAKKGIVPVMNDDVQIDLTYVDNVVEAIFCSLEAPESCMGEKYNITNGDPVDQLETMKSVMGRLGFSVREKRIPVERALKIAGALEWFYRTFSIRGEPMLTRYGVCALAYTRTLNIDKARIELGYVPRITMKEGLERTIPWFAQSHS